MPYIELVIQNQYIVHCCRISCFVPQSSHPCHHLPATDLLCHCEEEPVYIHTGNGSGTGDSTHDLLQVRILFVLAFIHKLPFILPLLKEGISLLLYVCMYVCMSFTYIFEPFIQTNPQLLGVWLGNQGSAVSILVDMQYF